MHGNLRCAAPRHLAWEYFSVSSSSKLEEGYVLRMTHWEQLWQVISKLEQGKTKMMKVENGAFNEIVWEFVKVQL